MALTLATVYFSSIALLFRCFSKERLIWAFCNHRWFFWIPFRLNCSLQKHSAFLFQCFSVFLSCTFKNIGDILKCAERFIMMTSFHPNYLFFPTCIILPVTTTWLILWHDKLDVGKNKTFLWRRHKEHSSAPDQLEHAKHKKNRANLKTLYNLSISKPHKIF